MKNEQVCDWCFEEGETQLRDEEGELIQLCQDCLNDAKSKLDCRPVPKRPRSY